MRNSPPQTVQDVCGPWKDPGVETSLINCCRTYWDIPVGELPNEALATFLRQNIAVNLIIPEAQRRIDADFHDDSEMYEDELAKALRSAMGD